MAERKPSKNPSPKGLDFLRQRKVTIPLVVLVGSLALGASLKLGGSGESSEQRQSQTVVSEGPEVDPLPLEVEALASQYSRAPLEVGNYTSELFQDSPEIEAVEEITFASGGIQGNFNVIVRSAKQALHILNFKLDDGSSRLMIAPLEVNENPQDADFNLLYPLEAGEGDRICLELVSQNDQLLLELLRSTHGYAINTVDEQGRLFKVGPAAFDSTVMTIEPPMSGLEAIQSLADQLQQDIDSIS